MYAVAPNSSRPRFRTAVGVLVALLLALATAIAGTPAPQASAAATPAFVQAKANEVLSGTSASAAFTNANTAGNLIVVYVLWSNTSTATITDTRGNTYAPAQAATPWNGSTWSSQVFYAKSIAGGTNTVKATFGTAVSSFGVIYAHEYSGLDRTSPLDVSKSAIGTSAAMSSGSATTTNPTDMIFGAGASKNSVTGVGAGYTVRSSAYGNRTFDRNVTTAGSYAATGTQSSNAWVMQLVAFKAAPSTTDTSPPSAPTGLTATPASMSRINLSWSPSTDNVGVTGYRIQRDGAQVGTSTTTSYADTGLGAGSTHTYTVTAVDAAGNVSPASGSVSATTQADTTAPSVPTGLAAQANGPTQVTLTWTAATDDVAVTGYDIFRDGTNITTVGSTSYTNTGLTAGTTYSYAVRSRDAAGNVSARTTAVDATTTAPDTTPPTVAVSAPAAGATISGTVSVGATATDDVGVSGVQLLVDGLAIGSEDTSSPYSASWDTTSVSNGTHQLTARARDAAGNTATSAARTVTVSNTAPPRTPGLVAGYPFDAASGTSAADVSGNNLTGTLANGATWTTGKYGGALDLDGTDDVVDLNNPTALRLTGSMTISAWINSSTFPADDAAIVSKRGTVGFQLDTTVDTGPRTIGFKLTTSTGGAMFRYGATAMQANTWYHVTGVYDATARTLHVYLNGQLDDGVLTGTVAAAQQDSTTDVLIGQRPTGPGFGFDGAIDDARIYGRALTSAEVSTDMGTPLGTSGPADTVPPLVTITAPTTNSQVSDIVQVTADADDNIGVASVQFFVDGVATGLEDVAAPYALAWDSRNATNGTHTLTARARDGTGNVATSSPVTVSVQNSNFFQNEILATGFSLPTAMKFLPDGRLLVSELAGRIEVVPAPYTTPSTTPFLTLTNIGSAGVQQGIYDFALDPDFATNRYFYVFYTLGTPNRDRLSRFTANAAGTGTVAGSELVLYQDPLDANAEHHGGAITFGNDDKLYFTTGEHFEPSYAQDLKSPRGKVHRINKDGTIPTDDPFYDGAGPNWDSIWAYGLRNPYRAYFDAPSNKLFIGDVGGNDASTAKEEVDVGARGANFGWPNYEGACPAGCTSPIYSWAHNGRDAAVTGGFVYHGSQFPASYQGSYFFADYTQNWIKRLTFDASGNVSGVQNFEPADGSVDGPYGDIVYLVEGPEGALYYLDLGYSDVGGTYGVSKLRRITYVSSNQAPVAKSAATPTSGTAPLTVQFSSAGSSDPENQPLTYAWTFGDGTTSSAANPSHTYATSGSYSARLTVSDGTSATSALPLSISVGAPPTATILTPTDGASFSAGDVISYSGDATDPDDGSLPASAYTWNIDFLHEGHVHPGTPVTGVKSGSFTIPTTGHDFSGNTRYRITLTVKDSSGLTDVKAVTVYPRKVNLTFDTVPSGLTLYLDGIAKTTPFVADTLVGFKHTVEARDQSAPGGNATFASWSDGGTATHVVTVPSADASYTATYTVTPVTTISFAQVAAATPQTAQSSVSVPLTAWQSVGNLNAVVVGWNDTAASITSVTDTAGNTYRLAAPLTRGSGLSQAVYYASGIAAGANTVTVAFDRPAAYADVRVAEYAGLDRTTPLDVTASAAGTAATASSGSATTTKARTLLLGAGTTSGGFTGAGTGFTSRIITQPDLDVLEDRSVTATGSYSATAPVTGAWVMQLVAFRGAGQ